MSENNSISETRDGASSAQTSQETSLRVLKDAKAIESIPNKDGNSAEADVENTEAHAEHLCASSGAVKTSSTTSFKPQLSLYRDSQKPENAEIRSIASSNSSESDSSDSESSDDEESRQQESEKDLNGNCDTEEIETIVLNSKPVERTAVDNTKNDEVPTQIVVNHIESNNDGYQQSLEPEIKVTSTATAEQNQEQETSHKDSHNLSSWRNDRNTYEINNSIIPSENPQDINPNNDLHSYLSNTSSTLKPQRSHHVMAKHDNIIHEDSQQEADDERKTNSTAEVDDENSAGENEEADDSDDEDAFVDDINNLRIIDQRSPIAQRKESIIQHSVAIPVINKRKSTTGNTMEENERIQNSVVEEPAIPVMHNKRSTIHSSVSNRSSSSVSSSSSSSSSDDDNDYDSEIEQFMYEPDTILEGFSNARESSNNNSYANNAVYSTNDKVDLSLADSQLLNSRIGKKLKLQREMNPETSKNDKDGSVANIISGNNGNSKSTASDLNDTVNGSPYEINNLILGTGYNSPGGSGLTINNVHLGEHSINYMNHNINIRKLNDELHLDYFNMRNFHNPLIKTIKNIYEYNKKNPLDFLALKRTSDTSNNINKQRNSGSTTNEDNQQNRQSHLQSFDSNRSNNVNKSLRNELMHLYSLQYNDNSSDNYSIRTKKTKRKHNLLMYSYENELFNIGTGNNKNADDLRPKASATRNSRYTNVKTNNTSAGANMKKKSGTTNLGKLLVRDSENTNLVNKVFDECINNYLNNHIVSLDYYKSQFVDNNSAATQTAPPGSHNNNFLNKTSRYGVPQGQMSISNNNKNSGFAGNNGIKKYNSMLNNAVTNNFINSRSNSNMTMNNGAGGSNLNSGNSSEHLHPTTKAQRYQHMKENNNYNNNHNLHNNGNTNRTQQNPVMNDAPPPQQQQQESQSQNNENGSNRGQYSNILNGDFLSQDMKSIN